MPLTFPNIVRYSVVGSLHGEECINVFDVEIEDTGGPLDTRAERIFTVAGDLLNQWSDHIVPLLVSTYTAEEVRWVDLDSATGSTGARSSTDGSTWPESGGGGSNPLPNNAYAKIVKALDTHTRTARNGATRLGGIPESMTAGLDGNQLNETARTSLTTAFENMKDGINGVDAGWTINMGVLHTINGEATGFTFVANFEPALNVGTLRRRMPGYGT